jgi:hypothetical protein
MLNPTSGWSSLSQGMHDDLVANGEVRIYVRDELGGGRKWRLF